VCAALIAVPTVVAGMTIVGGGPTSAASTETAIDTPTLKPALRGLVVTQPTALTTVPYAEFGSMKLPWHTIEKQPGVFDFSAIDAAMALHPDVRFRLRFMAGVHAPQWVKDRSGGCVLIEPDSVNGTSGCVPRYWTDAFHADYVALMRAVAARYEDDQQVVEIANSECTTIFAEPFILGANATSIDRLWRAGYTKLGHETCLRRSTSAMMSLFRSTRVSLAGHSKWQFIVQGPGGPGDGSFAASWDDERAMLNELNNLYGSRLVLDDHGLGPDDAVCPTPGETRLTATSWYCYLSGLRATSSSYGWQFTLNGGSMAPAADAGVAMGACFLEFAAFQALDQTKRRQVHDSLLANCADRVSITPTTPTDPPTEPTDPPTDPTKDENTNLPLTNVSAPELTGMPVVGHMLTASPGTWSVQPDAVTYQWFRGTRALAGATGPTYAVAPEDAGRRLRVQVTATRPDGVSGQATSGWVRVARA
jgi:hypothetical protein